MTTLLVDTQIVLWAGGAVDRLSAEVRTELEQPTNRVLVSAVSIAEMAIKQSIGKLSMPVSPTDLCTELGFELLALTGDHAQAIGLLPMHHRDPFDRLLIAQAIADELTLVTADRRILEYSGLSLLANVGPR